MMGGGVTSKHGQVIVTNIGLFLDYMTSVKVLKPSRLQSPNL